jgi:hypothetical protein
MLNLLFFLFAKLATRFQTSHFSALILVYVVMHHSSSSLQSWLQWLALFFFFPYAGQTEEVCRCFLHRQITESTRSYDSSSDVISRTNEHTRVYPGLAPSVEVIALHPAEWYWVKICVVTGEQSVQMVHMLKGVWISCLLSKGYESFYRRSWGSPTMVQCPYNLG